MYMAQIIILIIKGTYVNNKHEDHSVSFSNHIAVNHNYK